MALRSRDSQHLGTETRELGHWANEKVLCSFHDHGEPPSPRQPYSEKAPDRLCVCVSMYVYVCMHVEMAGLPGSVQVHRPRLRTHPRASITVLWQNVGLHPFTSTGDSFQALLPGYQHPQRLSSLRKGWRVHC